jgi:hypothetical protein
VSDALGSIGHVGKGALDKWKTAARRLQQGDGAVAVLHRGGLSLENG